MLTLYGKNFTSRLLLGTAQYPSPEDLKHAVEASGAEIVTVSLRRESARARTGQGFWALIEELGCRVLPNTAGCHTAKEAIATAADVIPMVFAANFSTGVNVLFAITRRVAKSLGKDFDLDVVEMHHRTKKDAPSGTAKRLLEILREVRSDSEINAQSIRAGDIVGEHIVIFSGPGERLELTHRAGSRETFAHGALHAARWVIAQPPGSYDMQDVLGLNDE